VLFAVALASALLYAGLAGWRAEGLLAQPPHLFAAGALVAFYVLAITTVAPTFGVGNAVFLVLLGQLLSSAAIDQFGLFGARAAPIDARRALGLLEGRGVLERRQGRGTFVARLVEERDLFHFFRLRDRDGRAVLPVLERQRIRRRRARRADAPLGDPEILEIERLRRIGGRLAAHERVALPAGLFAGLEGTEPPNALYPFYQRRFGVTILAAREAIVPAAATAADPCGLPEGTLLLRIERTARDVSGRTVEMRVAHYAMDGLSYDAEIS
ncbi:MAG: DMT family transporter, partial [Hasllibacter sp.]